MTNDNFYSIDRLVEFGMSIAMAQQMVQMMNQAMSQMNTPGFINTIPQPTLCIYVAIDGKPVGPIDEKEFIHFLSDKSITKDTQAWMPGMLDWKKICEVPAILKLVALAPPPLNV